MPRGNLMFDEIFAHMKSLDDAREGEGGEEWDEREIDHEEAVRFGERLALKMFNQFLNGDIEDEKEGSETGQEDKEGKDEMGDDVHSDTEPRFSDSISDPKPKPSKSTTAISPTPKFTYPLLDRTQHVSRLILLHPGTQPDPITCSLLHLPLSIVENPDTKDEEISRYIALSYVWGSPNPQRSITINNQPFPVGPNLYSALQHVRLEHAQRLVWVDAICINQSDIEERNWQVSKMGLIYRAAESVVAWMGEATQGAGMIFRCLETFEALNSEDREIFNAVPGSARRICEIIFGPISTSCTPQDGDGDEDGNEAEAILEEDESEGLTSEDKQIAHILWSQLDLLLERKLFWRSWIVQEIVLARSITLLCSHHSISYTTLTHALSLACSLRESVGIQSYSPSRTGIMKFLSISSLRAEMREPTCSITLFEIACRFGRLEATDPRDKIFALLGLSTKLIHTGTMEDHGFKPDYGMGVVEVFRKFAIFCIGRYDCLDVFSMPYRGLKTVGVNEGWPSWAPDWERRGVKDFGLLGLQAPVKGESGREYREFRARGETSVEMVYWKDVPNVLTLRGVKFDVVAEVVEGDVFPDPRTIPGDEEEWKEWLRLAMKDTEDGHGDPYGSTEKRFEALWRTLVADSDGRGNQAPSWFEEEFYRWARGDGLKAGIAQGSWHNDEDERFSEEENERYTQFADQLHQVTRGRKLFRTFRGYLGLGTWQVGEGCVVCVFHGAKLPILVEEAGTLKGVGRRSECEDEEAESLEVPVYRIAGTGDCYIHGIMDGEALEISKEEGDIGLGHVSLI
ncbi:hypothetical protein IFR05_006667 [Cadophora sp. M221]|nr:hypothetical protein IFR05_006667 [Cadophora sp. M221]